MAIQMQTENSSMHAYGTDRFSVDSRFLRDPIAILTSSLLSSNRSISETNLFFQ